MDPEPKPQFRTNNSQQAPNNYPWPAKIGGRKMTNFCKRRQKTGRKSLFPLLIRKTIEFFVGFLVSCFPVKCMKVFVKVLFTEYLQTGRKKNLDTSTGDL
jgi:hypothetical protein